jgi:hypothetical protein
VVGTCPLCGRSAEISPIPDGDKIDCTVCGHFAITGSALATANLDRRLKQKIGFWTRDQNDIGDLPVLSSYDIDQLKTLPEKTVKERADRLLTYAVRKQQDLGNTFSLLAPMAIGYTHSRSDPDITALAGLLVSQGLLRDIGRGIAQVTPRGFIQASEVNLSGSVNGFIAMWFDKSMVPARTEGLELAIRDAGYTPVIVSGVEHVNKIDDEIVSQIRKSKFVVADFTGHRGGVYFEAGFAMGLGLPVFWTCRSDDLAKLHFDIRQYNCIDWADTADLSKRLRRRIEAVIGVGPVRVVASG